MTNLPKLPTVKELRKELKKIDLLELTENSVVLIGSYSAPTLKTIRDCFEEANEELKMEFSPVEALYVKDRPGMTPRQKLHAMLSVCGFVIAEDSIPCGEMIELEYCRHTGAITAIMHRGQRSSYMTLDCDLHSPDFKQFPYNSSKKSDIKYVIKEIINWVNDTKEKRHKETKKFDTVELASSKYCARETCTERHKF